jgi:hypothetical protein
VILQWEQKRPELNLQWRGPNKLSTKAISSMEEVASILAVISGPRGAKGEDGTVQYAGADATFSWSPAEASDSWVISHTLNKYPSVTVFDTTGRLVIPEVTYLNTSLVQIDFAFPTSGTAVLN